MTVFGVGGGGWRGLVGGALPKLFLSSPLFHATSVGSLRLYNI